MFSLGKELYTQCKTFRKYEKRFQNHILLYFLELTPDNILVYFLLVFFFFVYLYINTYIFVLFLHMQFLLDQ